MHELTQNQNLQQNRNRGTPAPFIVVALWPGNAHRPFSYAGTSNQPLWRPITANQPNRKKKLLDNMSIGMQSFNDEKSHGFVSRMRRGQKPRRTSHKI